MERCHCTFLAEVAATLSFKEDTHYPIYPQFTLGRFNRVTTANMPSFLQSGSPTSTVTSQSTPSMASNRLLTGASVRKASRNGSHKTTTAGFAPTYLQANLIILPSRYATDFRLLCARNPVPCPLLAESKASGSWGGVKSWIEGLSGDEIISRFDIRRDAPKYMVYRDSKLVKFQCDDIFNEWSEDHVAFFIGCSFSFESALVNAGLPPRHSVLRRNVPMYRTNVPLCPAGVFTSGKPQWQKSLS